MTNTAAARVGEGSATLYLAFELGKRSWKLGFTTALAPRPRERNVSGGDTEAVLREIVAAKQRFGLPQGARVVSCYEAGRAGFWLHRWLVAQGIENRVVDSSSIEVKRRQRRAKTDRMDVGKLLGLLRRYEAGERGAWSVVHVPAMEQEDGRQLHRELLTTKRDRTRVTNRIQGLLASHGLEIALRNDVPTQLEALHQWDGSPLPPGLRERLLREWQKVAFLNQQIRKLEAERRQRVRECPSAEMEKVRQLLTLRGVGANSAWLYTMEFFGWRRFRNGKEIGALAGLTPTPHQSGELRHELGIVKAGNRHVRWMVIEGAWAWLRFQPDSELSQWYQERFGQGGRRMRKVGIVALARKLLIALWQFLETGELPKGAVLKTRIVI